jgi:hypothetical protein
MMETVRTSETWVYINETTRRSIPEYCHLHPRCSKVLKSHYVFLYAVVTYISEECITSIFTVEVTETVGDRFLWNVYVYLEPKRLQLVLNQFTFESVTQSSSHFSNDVRLPCICPLGNTPWPRCLSTHNTFNWQNFKRRHCCLLSN